MSTCYRLSNRESALAKKDFVKAMASYGVRVVEESQNRTKGFCLSDGRNYLWAYPAEGKVADFEQFGGNDPTEILDFIEEVCSDTVLSEHDEDFFGKNVEEEDEGQ